MRDLLKNFRKAPLKKKLLIIAVYVAIVISFIFAGLIAIGNMVKNLKLWLVDPGANRSLLYYAWNTGTGRPLSIIFIGAIVFLNIWLLVSNNKRNFTDGQDEDGIHYMEQEIFGSARKMTKDEAKEVYNVSSADEATNEIYGQFTQKGEQVVSYKEPVNAPEKNRNIVVVAPSGSGKTYTTMNTMALQHINNGRSVVITCPGGGGYRDLVNYVKSKNIKYHCFNLDNTKYSDSWDCLKECIDDDTGRLSDSRLKDFARTFMANTGNSDDEFFFRASCNLLMTIIGYTVYFHEKTIVGNYEKLYMTVSGVKFANAADDEFISRLSNEYLSFKWCEERIMSVALEKGYEKAYIENCFKKIKEYAEITYPFNLTKLCENIYNYSQVETDLNNKECEIPPWHPAFIAYTTYKQQERPDVKNSAIQGVQDAFNVFTDKALKANVSEPGINLKRLNQEQTVLFVITQDKSAATKAVASLFFSFIFFDTQDVYDKQADFAELTNSTNPSLPVSIFLDDFFSLGVISGDPEIFATYMSDARKRKLYIVIAIQNYKQFQALYGEDFTDSIQSNCSTLLCLGANDTNTAEFVSKMCGDSTKLGAQHSEIDNALSLATMNAGVRIKGERAALIPPGDILGMDNQVLIKRQGTNHILIVNPMPYVDLPCYDASSEAWRKTSIMKEMLSYDDKHPWSKIKQGNIEQKAQDVVDKLLANLKISKKYDINFETGEIISDENGEIKDKKVNNAPKVQDNLSDSKQTKNSPPEKVIDSSETVEGATNDSSPLTEEHKDVEFNIDFDKL